MAVAFWHLYRVVNKHSKIRTLLWPSPQQWYLIPGYKHCWYSILSLSGLVDIGCNTSQLYAVISVATSAVENHETFHTEFDLQLIWLWKCEYHYWTPLYYYYPVYAEIFNFISYVHNDKWQILLYLVNIKCHQYEVLFFMINNFVIIMLIQKL